MPFPINGFNKIFMRNPFLIAFLLIVSACSQAPESGQKAIEMNGYRFLRLETEKLPSLNQPRGGHVVAYLNGELTVFGGHTDGFIPLKTAEYLSGGRWIEVPMLYPHDFGFSVKLPDGSIMIGGGCVENFGIGQSWGTEIYDPKTHAFEPSGVLDRKRTGCSAIAFPDGRVLVTGNWYADDDMEIYEPGKGFSFKKPVSVQRRSPLILQTDSSQAIVLSYLGNRGDTCQMIADRLEGEAFQIPLLHEWSIFPPINFYDSRISSIGDYTYLIPAKRKIDGRFGILKVSGEQFSLLNMEKPLPEKGVEGDSVAWGPKIQVNRQTRKAYLVGYDLKKNFYVAEIDYDATLDGGKASIVLYYSDILKDFSQIDESWDLLGDGRIVLAGGCFFGESGGALVADNFKTNSCVFVFSTKPKTKSLIPFWIIAACIIAVIGITALLYSLLRKKPEEKEEENNPAASKPDPNLEEQISRLIEEKELFKKKDLRIGDIASELATNRTYISLIVNSSLGTNFSDLINGYRIKYAQMLMTEHPEMSHTDVAEESGFSSRTSFLRTFKAKTGMTPTEWKESNSAS
jgi:AraC-like DNA-binding protein